SNRPRRPPSFATVRSGRPGVNIARMADSDSGVRFPIARKLSIAFALLAAVPLVGLGAYVVDVDRTTLRVLTQHLQGAVGDSVAAVVDEELRGAEDGLESIGRILLDPTLDEASTTRLAQARI